MMDQETRAQRREREALEGARRVLAIEDRNAEERRKTEAEIARRERIMQEREEQLRAHAARVPDWIWRLNRVSDQVPAEVRRLFILHPEAAADYPRPHTARELQDLTATRQQGAGIGNLRQHFITERQREQKKFIAALQRTEAEAIDAQVKREARDGFTHEICAAGRAEFARQIEQAHRAAASDRAALGTP